MKYPSGISGKAYAAMEEGYEQGRYGTGGMRYPSGISGEEYEAMEDGFEQGRAAREADDA